MGMSIINLLEPLKGTPVAKSSPKSSKNNTATTIPKIHKAFGMEASPGNPSVYAGLTPPETEATGK
jgi:hypothetical protein